MTQIKTFVVPSKLGPIFGAVGDKGLLALIIPNKGEKEFAQRVAKRAPGAQAKAVDPAKTAAGLQLLEYLQGRRREFSVPLDLDGLTPFHRQALLAVKEIPYGQTRTYGQIAASVGRPKAARAVGQANHVNPIPIFIP
jgi:O6-methylguanine-DNA--protein-cysteine methyltransferase